MPHLLDAVTVTLEYSDADGIETRRTVDVYRTAKKNGYTTITGWCHGRQAERSFRSDRVKAVINEYGEVMSVGRFLAGLVPERSREVSMSSPAGMSTPAGSQQAPPPPRRKFGLRHALTVLAFTPAVLLAAASLIMNRDIGLAIFALIAFGAPVAMAIWLIRIIIRWLHT